MTTDNMETMRREARKIQATIEALRWRSPAVYAALQGASIGRTFEWETDAPAVRAGLGYYRTQPLADILARVQEMSLLLDTDPDKREMRSPNEAGATVSCRWTYRIPRSDMSIRIEMDAAAECPIKPRPVVAKVEARHIEAGEIVTGYTVAPECLAALEDA